MNIESHQANSDHSDCPVCNPVYEGETDYESFKIAIDRQEKSNVHPVFENILKPFTGVR